LERDAIVPAAAVNVLHEVAEPARSHGPYVTSKLNHNEGNSQPAVSLKTFPIFSVKQQQMHPISNESAEQKERSILNETDDILATISAAEKALQEPDESNPRKALVDVPNINALHLGYSRDSNNAIDQKKSHVNNVSNYQRPFKSPKNGSRGNTTDE
jgi:hypothetical protein